MKIIIIGGVAAGTSAAVRARRNSEDVEIAIYDRDVDLAHAGFATHYAVSGVVKGGVEELSSQTPKWFKETHNIDVHMQHEITKIDHENKTIYGINLETNKEFEDNYDKLLIATGSSVSVPPVFRDQSFDNVFTIKNVERGRKLDKFLKENKPKNVVVVGTGYIGLGVSEQLTNAGLNVTTLDFLKYPMAQLDQELSARIINILEDNKVTFHGDDGVVELVSSGGTLNRVITANGQEYEADMFILATGVRPNTALAESIGVKTGVTGAIKVNEKLETNLKDVYAAGDVAEAFYSTTKNPFYLPLATTANKMGYVAGDALTGGKLSFTGVLGTSAVRLFGQTIAATGLTEKQARAYGIDPIVMVHTKPDTLPIMGGKDMLIKAIADPDTEELLGVQMIGPDGVERRNDVFATAIYLKAKVSDLINIDLAFTPPISTPKDPVMYTAMGLTNAIEGATLLTPEEFNQMREESNELQIIDVRSETDYEKSHLKDAINIPLVSLRDSLEKLNKAVPTILYCDQGEESYIGQKILMNNNFHEVYNLSGGLDNYKVLYNENVEK